MPLGRQVISRGSAGATQPNHDPLCGRLSGVSGFVITAHLSAPVEVAWAFVVDRGHEIEPLNFEPQGPQGVGMLNSVSGRLFGVPIRGMSRTIIWDPPERCAFESVKPMWPVRTRVLEEFVPTNGGTQHSIHYEVVPAGVVGRVAAPLMCALMKRSRREYQDRLRAALESEVPPSDDSRQR